MSHKNHVIQCRYTNDVMMIVKVLALDRRHGRLLGPGASAGAGGGGDTAGVCT